MDKISVALKTLRKQGVEDVCVKVLEDYYKETTAAIRLHNVNEKIPIKKFVRQGDTISPKLFTVVSKEIFKNLDWRESRNYDKCKIPK